MKRHDRPVENPADAWELRPKTTAGESMDVNQLLNYKVKQGCSAKATRNHGRHSHQAMHYAYLVSAEDRRPQVSQRVCVSRYVTGSTLLSVQGLTAML